MEPVTFCDQTCFCFSVSSNMFYVYHVFHSTNISLKHITCFVSMECLITMGCFKLMEYFNKVFLINGVFHINGAYHKFHINGAYHHITCFSFLIFYINGANNGLWSDVFPFFKIAINQKLDSAYLSDGFLYSFLFWRSLWYMLVVLYRCNSWNIIYNLPSFWTKNFLSFRCLNIFFSLKHTRF